MNNVLYLVLLFILSYLFLQYYFENKEAKKYKKKNSRFLGKNDTLEKTLKKINFVKSKDKFLSKQGYPLNLNIASYYVVKFSFATVFFLSAKINYDSVPLTLFFTLSGFFMIDLYILLNKKSRDSQICIDLLNVSNSIQLQLSANIMLKDSLKKQFENCKNKDFKKAMLKFSTQYELSELDLENALKELKTSFDIPEVEMFCNSLSEYTNLGDIIEILENLSETLREKYLEKIRGQTRNKVLYLTFGVVIALGNIIMITFYPLFVSLSNNMNSIFN